MITEQDMPTNIARYAITVEGYAIDIPLGVQEPPFFWHDNPSLVERITAARRKHKVVVADDMLNDAESSVVVEDSGPEEPMQMPPGKKKAQRRDRGEVKSWDTFTVAEYKSFLALSFEQKGTPGVFPAQLRKYWLGKGLARWATTATPYRSLRAALRSEGVAGRFVDGLAAKLYHWHFGRWPGKRGNKKSDGVLTELEAKLIRIDVMENGE